MTLEELRAKFPQYSSVPDLDFLMGVHRKMYPGTPMHDFIAAIPGADMAVMKGAKGPSRDYYVSQVSQPMQGETPEQTAARVGGTAQGPVGDPGGQFGTMVRSGFQGATMGFGDEAVAGVASALSPDMTYDQALKAERDRLDLGRDQFPKTAIASEIGGAVAVPVGAASGAGSLAARATSGAVAGVAQGGLYGFGAGEGGFLNRSLEAAKTAGIGALAGAVIPVLGAGVQRIADSAAAKKAIRDIVKGAPSTDALRDMGSAAYKAVDDAGVTVLPSAMRGASDNIISSMKASGLDDTGGMLSLTPKSARVAQLLDEAPSTNAPIPFSAVDQLRRKAGIAASDVGNKTEAQLGSKAIAGLDDFIAKLSPADVAGGDVAALNENIGKAREIWAKMSRSQLLDDAIAAGDNYVSGTGSGIRNQFSRILKNPKLARGFSDTEKAVMKKVANGSIPEKMLQMAGSGIGNIAAMTGGAIGGGIPGMLAGGVLAAGLRKASDAATASRAEFARAFVAGGGMKVPPKASPAARNAIEELLMRALRPSYPQAAQTATSLLSTSPR